MMDVTRSLWLLLLMQFGSAQVVTNPTNLTVCLGSPATFTCVINGIDNVHWLINGINSSLFSLSQTTNASLDGLRLQSTLNISTDGLSNGTTFACQYNDSTELVQSSPAYLYTQGRPSSSTNITSTPLNATASLLTWQPPVGVQSQLLSYAVKVSNCCVAYTVTVVEPQIVISLPDPCDTYEALIRPQCQHQMAINNDTVELQGDSPAIISHVDVSFPSSSEDNVTVNIVQSGVCYYSVVALAESMLFDFHGLSGLATISLPPKYNYTLIINAFNVYGNTTSTITLNTFDVTGIASTNSSTTGLLCTFSPGTQAIGCLALLTEVATGSSFCVVIPRYVTSPVNTSMCPAPTNCSSLRSIYTVRVYDISLDGNVSTIPSIPNVNLSLVQDFCNNSALNTFDVTGIASTTASTTGLLCTFSPGTQAIGCLALLTEVATGSSFCVVIPRYANKPLNTSMCPAPTNCSSLGLPSIYTVRVYDISGNGEVSKTPSIPNATLSLVQDFCNNGLSDSSITLYAIIGGIIGGAIVVGMILILIIGCTSKKARYNVNQKKSSEQKDRMAPNDILLANKNATQDTNAVVEMQAVPLGYELAAQNASKKF